MYAVVLVARWCISIELGWNDPPSPRAGLPASPENILHLSKNPDLSICRVAWLEHGAWSMERVLVVVYSRNVLLETLVLVNWWLESAASLRLV
ncbi:hypothetical protein [Pseudovibrio sp. JE062]|uniref:hypothetical protein n=1 Tax=Pseudovibrio sp. JE062 TaxID=439495 RepID=UPI000186C38D|nr:hypothetical protein [Pseudovibrio sp. JE062]EEA91789.1 hypothetical protein PJE062_953 [Pseudovibrio sp. JE062]